MYCRMVLTRTDLAGSPPRRISEPRGWEMTRAGLEDAEYLMMLLDKVSTLRELCQSSEVTCDEDVLTSTQSALAALGRVDQVKV